MTPAPSQPPQKPLTPALLRRWRLKYKMTQREAGLWYGAPEQSAQRQWQRFELGERSPTKLLTALVTQTRAWREIAK